MFIPINLDDIREAKPVPNGVYNLRITNCELTESREKKTPQFRVSIAIDGHEDAQTVTHYVSIPSELDDPDKMRTKALFLKRFLHLFKIPYDANGLDVEALAMSMVGAEARAELILGDPDENGNVYNRLVVPRLKDESSPKGRR